MRPNLNEQYDSNILTLFRNGITYCNIEPYVVTLIAFELIYSNYSMSQTLLMSSSNSSLVYQKVTKISAPC